MLGTMWTRHRADTAAPARLLVSLLAPGLLVACLSGLTGCTDEPASRPRSAPSPTSTSTGSAPSLRERPAPYEIGYRSVAGTLPQARRQLYLHALARPVRVWVDNGFVRGPWPREGFAGAFAPFGRHIGDRARRDADLLTLEPVGRSLVEVVPQRRRVAVSVTAARGHVVGATARVDLRVLAVDRDGGRMRVNLRGDLYLTRVPSHGWQIFGYRLDRWVDQGAMTRGGG
jgi:hypothetical protein